MGKKADEELWEGEELVYACENTTLVIDNNPDMTTAVYKCVITGEYNTPKGKEQNEPWPECTLKPIRKGE